MATKKTVKKATPRTLSKAEKAEAATKAAAKKVTTKKAAPKKTGKMGLAKATTAKVGKRLKGDVLAPAPERKEPPSKRTALAIADAGLEKKAVNIQIIDVYGKVDYADYLVVMSGRSDRQVSALARGIAEDVERNIGEKCYGIEGLPEGAWVLMDFGDVVVHIFHDDVRGYYDLESLWIDAARVPVPNQTPA